MTTGYLGDSGIVLNQTDEFGVFWGWTGGDPWSPSPAPRTITGERVTDHGSWDATEYYGPRSYPLEGWAKCADHTELHRAKHRLFAVCALRGFTFRVVEPGFDRQGTFRRDGEVLWSELADLKTARFSAPLWARDPRAYSTTVKNASTTFPSGVGGLTLPFTVPLTIPGTVTTGELSLTNDGNIEAFPIFRIDGPVLNPGVVDMRTGKTWRLKLDVADGEWVTVDTATHQVLAMGDPGGTRRNTWSGDWFGLEPGGNTFKFVGGSAGVGAQLSASWRSAWI